MLGEPKFKVDDHVFSEEAIGVLCGIVTRVERGSWRKGRDHVYAVLFPHGGVLYGTLVLTESRLRLTVTQEIVNAYRSAISSG